jgi:electron transfer flavoprotein alpha/beta subunit
MRKLGLDGGRIRAERESDDGIEQVEARMPALIA